MELDNDPGLPRFTLVSDREAYSPAFFQRLWDKHQIAIITYRKNVKDVWDKNDFNEFIIDIEGSETKMPLAEKSTKLDNVPMREVRFIKK